MRGEDARGLVFHFVEAGYDEGGEEEDPGEVDGGDLDDEKRDFFGFIVLGEGIGEGEEESWRGCGLFGEQNRKGKLEKGNVPPQKM